MGLLNMLGADVYGLSLSSLDGKSYLLSYQREGLIKRLFVDIRDIEQQNNYASNKSEVVFHLAAQPLVRESYKN